MSGSVLWWVAMALAIGLPIAAVAWAIRAGTRRNDDARAGRRPRGRE